MFWIARSFQDHARTRFFVSFLNQDEDENKNEDEDEAEVVAIIFVVQLISKLSKLSFYVLPAQQDGACAQGSGRR